MNARERTQLWNWINEYTVACGGDPSDTRHARERREEAVARIEATVEEIEASSLRAYRKAIADVVGALDEQGREKAATFLEERIRDLEGQGLLPGPDVKVEADPADPTKVHVSVPWPVRKLEMSLIDLPENPTPKVDPKDAERLSRAVADWMTRGNMRHQDKPRSEEVEVERAKLRAEAEERAAEMTPATVEERVEFVKKAMELGCEKLIGEPEYVGKMPERQDIPCDPKPERQVVVPFTDDPMGHPPGSGVTPEQIEAARKGILEHEDAYILAEMQRITAVQADEDAKVHERLASLLGKTIDGKPGYEGRDPADLVCVHASGSECECVCHADPPKGIIIHDRHCCETCFKCGFRTVLP